LLGVIHAYGERAEKLRDRLAFSFCKKLSSLRGVVGDEGARDAQTGARCQAELSMLIFGGPLALKVVDPVGVVERVEKSFKRGGRLSDAHRAITLVKVVGHTRRPKLARPNGAHLSGGNLLARFRAKVCGAFVARASREPDG
jgi:hypothetical protein